MFQAPYREIGLISNNDRVVRLSFEDTSSPIIPALGPGVPNHSLYDFPDGTIFKFRAKDDVINIQKTGVWNDPTKEIVLTFVPLDTSSITKNRRVPYELDAIFPVPVGAPIGTEPERHTILVGDLVIFATRNLNG